MTSDPIGPFEARYSDDETRKVIERAIELQEHRNSDITATQLQSILTEMGVAPEAIAQAMSDVIAERRATSEIRLAALPAVHSATFGVAVGSIAATAATLLPGDLMGVGAMLVVGVMFSGHLVARNKTGKSMMPFQAANLALWLGLGGSYIAIDVAARFLLAGASAGVHPWAFPVMWVFTSIAGLLLSSFERHEGNLRSSSIVLRTLDRAKARLVSWVKERLQFANDFSTALGKLVRLVR